MRQNYFLIAIAALFIALSGLFHWQHQSYLALFPIGLLALYGAIFHPNLAYFALALFTPLSINIEEYTDSFGLFIPTEPLLFGMMLLLVFQQLRKPFLPVEIWRNPIVWAAGFYVFWILVTSITSELPLVSFKFLLVKLWFIVPLLLFGTVFFLNPKHIRLFLWLFMIGMIGAILFTLINHAQYRFGEKEGHWVMWPFFKDHTIYGALVGLITPVVFGIYFSKKHSPLVQAVLLGFMLIILLGLYFSYTRAAWLSVVAALGVLLVIKLKIPFKYLAGVTALAGLIVLSQWTQIQHTLERNKYEHTTEEFGERLQSATNVTTDASNLERLNRWSCAMDMFYERPLVGFGPGTYAFEYARFQRPENLTIISTNFGDLGNAHSEYLGPLAEMGIFGLVAMLLLTTAIFYQGVTLYLKWPAADREMRTLILTLILALTTYFVHGFLNNYLDTDKASVPIWSMCAMFIALSIQLKREEGVRENQV